MSELCRTCGRGIQGFNVKDVFGKDNGEILKNIYTLTGMWLTHKLNMPKNMCTTCLLDLNNALSFRERCIKTQSILEFAAANNSSDSKLATTSGNPIISVEQDPVDIKQEQLSESDDCGDSELLEQLEALSNEQDSQPEETYTCKYCGEVFNTSNAMRHQLCHRDHLAKSDKSLNCKYCNKSCANSRMWKKHQLEHTGAGERPFRCDICDMAFSRSFHLKTHFLSYFHRKKVDALNEPTSDSESKQFPCKYCPKSFNSKSTRFHHQRTHLEYEGNKKLNCRFCNRLCQNKQSLKEHELMHTEERRYRCEICDVAFNRISSLHNHMRSNSHSFKAQQAEEKNMSETELDETPDSILST